MKSWKTTLCGVLAVAFASAQTAPDLSPWLSHMLGVAATTATGLGLLFARDNNVTSEQAGLNNPKPPDP